MSRTFKRLLRAYYRLNEIERTPPSERNLLDRWTLTLRKGWLFTAISKRYSAAIPVSATIERGVKFPHDFNGIHIADNATIGAGTLIFQHVTIGSDDAGEAPVVGKNVLIGAGAALIGRTVIGDGARIGANVVLTDVRVPAGAIIVNNSAYDVANRCAVYPSYKRAALEIVRS